MKKVHLNSLGYRHGIFECGVYREDTLRVGTNDVSRVTCLRCLEQFAQGQEGHWRAPRSYKRGRQLSLSPCPCANWFEKVGDGEDICKECGWR